ncbi:MAG: hypothetical protein V3V85_02455 [Candidatus Thorarchaeota archaeon]
MSKRLFNYITDPDRARRIRYKHRQGWYDWQQTAIRKNSSWRMRLAIAYGTLWKFIATPDEAKNRGDLPNKAKP